MSKPPKRPSRAASGVSASPPGSAAPAKLASPPGSTAFPISDFLPAATLGVNGSLWIENDGQRFFGPGPVQLLELIQETGSINQAAKKMGMSYKKAWNIINHLNATALHPLVVTAAGGTGGGGSTISSEAVELIAWYRELRERFSQFLEQETEKLKK